MEAGGGLDVAQPRLDCCSSDFTQFEPPLFHLNTAMHGLFVPRIHLAMQCNAMHRSTLQCNLCSSILWGIALQSEHRHMNALEKLKTNQYCCVTWLFKQGVLWNWTFQARWNWTVQNCLDFFISHSRTDRMRTGHDIKGVFGIYETALSKSIWYLPHEVFGAIWGLIKYFNATCGLL